MNLIDALEITNDNVSISEDEISLYIEDLTFIYQSTDKNSCEGCAFRKKCAVQHLSPIVMCGSDNNPRADRGTGIWVLYTENRWWTSEPEDTRTDDEKLIAQMILG